MLLKLLRDWLEVLVLLQDRVYVFVQTAVLLVILGGVKISKPPVWVTVAVAFLTSTGVVLTLAQDGISVGIAVLTIPVYGMHLVVDHSILLA
jgi:hypothetical protein